MDMHKRHISASNILYISSMFDMDVWEDEKLAGDKQPSRMFPCHYQENAGVH
jgi:hypothetical protein